MFGNILGSEGSHSKSEWGNFLLTFLRVFKIGIYFKTKVTNKALILLIYKIKR